MPSDAPNFTTGAVLMMQFAKAAAPYFPEAEVLEFHHARKLDAPSGTAVRTAQIIAEVRGHRASEASGRETEIPGAEGARGALVDGVPVHSVRSMGYVASQGGRVSGLWAETLCPSATTAGTAPPTCLAYFSSIRSVGAEEGLILRFGELHGMRLAPVS